MIVFSTEESPKKVVKESREDVLEKVYQRLEATYEYEGKAEQLNCLQEMMVVFSTLANKHAILLFTDENKFDFRTWYAEKDE